jgi:class 3 adenylate cyclase/tetratricopeptide (TPR) repeat protein
MLCGTCGTQNLDGKRFCKECGSPLVAGCQSCGAALAGDERFCSDCGTPVSGAAAVAADEAAARTAPAAERRLVSVLFVDLVGFTSLSEARDSEEVRELLSRYFDMARRLIELYGGTVEKFIGDAVMAVWGAPVATEDDAERAVRAGLDLVAAVSALGQEVGAEELRARGGVLTGEAAVTVGADAEGMVAGDIVNTASRMQSAAEPGQVYVGEATRRATEQAIVYESAGSFELKGKDGLTLLWRAVRVVSGVGGTLKSHGLEAPFVGRDRQLQRIKGLFHTTAEEGRAQLVSVTGVAGIGKSRLAWEFYKYFDGLAQLVYWHRGRCLAYGEGVTYWALADMVRMRCRIAEDEAPETALPKLQATIEEHLLDPDERRFVEPRLAALLAIGDLENRDRQDMFAAWRLFFERLAEAYPTVLAFEDMQWADESLLDFVEYLLDWSRNSPLYVITLARPELLDRRPTWGAGQRSFTSLYLDPLSPKDMGDLITGLVPGLPDTLQHQILERSEGVPLYAVETVRMLLDRGALVQEGSVYRPTGTIETLAVPETLHALIAARLDGLPDDERLLLQDASVLGKTFTSASLGALAGVPEPELHPRLTALVRKEVLSLQSDPRSPEHGQYGFLQDLVRRVAYETLSRRERRVRHLAAARYLAGAGGEDEVAEVVASHLVEAYELDRAAPDAADIRGQARAALAGAGDRARSLGAPGEAQRYFERAESLADGLVEQAELAALSGQMALLAGRMVESRSHFERAESLLRGLGDDRGAARVSAGIAELDFGDGRAQQSIDRLERAFAAVKSDDPDADSAELAERLGRFLAVIGEERAIDHLEYALGAAERLDLPEVLAQALSSKGVWLLQRDRLYEARVLLRASMEIALAHDLHHTALRSNNNLGVVLEAADEFAEDVVLGDRGIALARRIGDRRWEAGIVGGAIVALVMLGRWDEALLRASEAESLATSSFASNLILTILPVHCQRGELERARELFERYADESDVAQSILAQALAEATLLLAEGRVAEARAAAEHALALCEEPGGSAVTGLPYKQATEAVFESALAGADTVRARQLLSTLEGLRPGERTPLLRAQEARFRARLAAADGVGDPARAFTVAASLFRGLETRPLLAATLVEHGEWLAGEGREADASVPLAEAGEIFTDLQARPWLERIDAARAPAARTA